MKLKNLIGLSLNVTAYNDHVIDGIDPSKSNWIRFVN
jgi:hypothetical protein